MTLREVREKAVWSQARMAAAIGLDQPEVSRLEKRSDHLTSTLRRYVEALGGELVVCARFGTELVQLKGA